MPSPGAVSYTASFTAADHAPATTMATTMATTIVSAHGELDAANAQHFVDFALENAAAREALILDLRDVEFFGTAGFSALHTLNVRCAGKDVQWALVAGRAVSRVLTICDPDSALPVCPTIDDAADTLASGPRRLLKLIPESS